MMDTLIEKAQKFMRENPTINEVELSDGTNKVRIIRNIPTIWCNYPYPYTITYQQQY